MSLTDRYEAEWGLATQLLATAKSDAEGAIAALAGSELPPALRPFRASLVEVFQSSFKLAVQAAEDRALSGLDRRGRRRSVGLAAIKACQVAAKEFVQPSLDSLPAAEAMASALAAIDHHPRGSPYRFRDPLFERGEWLDRIAFDLGKIARVINPQIPKFEPSPCLSPLGRLKSVLSSSEAAAWAKLARLDRIGKEPIPEIASSELGMVRTVRYAAAGEIHGLRTCDDLRAGELIASLYVCAVHRKSFQDHDIKLLESFWRYVGPWGFGPVTELSERHERCQERAIEAARQFDGTVSQARDYVTAKYAELSCAFSQAARAVDPESKSQRVPVDVLEVASSDPQLALETYVLLIAIRDGIVFDEVEQVAAIISSGCADTMYVEFFLVPIERAVSEPAHTYFAIDRSERDRCVVRLPAGEILDRNGSPKADPEYVYAAATFIGGAPESIRVHMSGAPAELLASDLSNAVEMLSRNELGVERAYSAATRKFFDQTIGSGRKSDKCVCRPVGALSTLPIEAIAVDGKQFGMTKEVLYLHVSPILHIVRDDEVVRSPVLLAIGGCDYDAPLQHCGFDLMIPNIRYPFEALPASKIEIFDLHSKFETRLLAGRAANRPNVEDAIWEAPNIIHFATHGFYVHRENNLHSALRPLLPLSFLRQGEASGGILLSGANSGINEQGNVVVNSEACLEFSEIVNFDLSSTSLVTLSACHSGVGERTPWSGSLGIREAFLSAGAKSVVASLWEVDDNDTADFMHHFYRGLRSGMSVSAALLQARQRSEAADAVKFAFVVVGSNPKFS